MSHLVIRKLLQLCLPVNCLLLVTLRPRRRHFLVHKPPNSSSRPGSDLSRWSSVMPCDGSGLLTYDWIRGGLGF
ncbi:hypothetical protein C8Q75DRAFT_788841 [Abortiporus biennis]|nr:hypothetical protein C8Q75DRAFT_788841 [Abortiporus biennis]